ncbi:MAG TPA: XrtA/PEP-CTERM system TPR-repeat protein PrsT [Steroidobacteraceae bacterium]|nr:XrtA/PEP-CTERM system TPR-repeat protein PrsT [Steroidobacteraceae bacterium]
MKKLTHRTRILSLAVALALAAGCSADPAELMQRAEASLQKGDPRSAMIDLKSLLQKDEANARARALLGEAYALVGDYGAAEIELAKAKELGAPQELVLLPSCRVMASQSKFDEVLKDCSPDAASGARKVQFQLVNGSALLGLQRTAESKAMFQQALAAEPSSLDALLGVAAAAQAEGGAEAAKAVLDGAGDAIKKQGRYWLAHAGLNVASGDLAAAEADYARALETAQGAPDAADRIMALGGLAETQMRAGKVAEAEATAEKLNKLAPNNPLVKQLRGQIAAAGGKTEEARTLLEEVVAAQPRNTQARTILAIVNMQQGNLDQAQMHLQQVVASEPQNARAQRLLAEVRAQLKSPGESLAGIQGALDETGNSPEMLAMAGRLSLASGNKQQALNYLAAASKGAAGADPQTQLDVANGLLMAGEIDRALEVIEAMPSEGTAGRQRDALLLLTLLRKGDQAKMLQEADAILKRSPDDAGLRNVLGGVYAAAKKPDLAREQFNAAAKLAPNDVTPVINLARLDLSLGKNDAAEASFKRALEKDSKNLPALLGLAAIANARKDVKTTEKLLLQAKDAHPEAVDVRLALGQFYLLSGDVAKAKAVADAAVKENPKSGAMANARGTILLAAQDRPGAVASFEEAVRLDPKSALFAANLARGRLANNDASGALTAVNTALEAQPQSAPLLAFATATALQVGQTERAAGYVERLRQVAPDAPGTHALEGDLAAAQKRYKEALDHYRKASANGSNAQLVLAQYNAATRAGEPKPEAVLENWVAANPGDVTVVAVLGEQRRAQGNLDGAVAVYEAALVKSPNDIVTLNNLAIIYDAKGNGAKAADYASRAYKAAPKAPAIADTYGWILFRQGKTSEAAPLLNQAAKGLPDNAEVQYHLGALLAKTGDKGEAARMLRKAVGGQLPPDQKAEAQKLLQQLGN